MQLNTPQIKALLEQQKKDLTVITAKEISKELEVSIHLAYKIASQIRKTFGKKRITRFHLELYML